METYGECFEQLATLQSVKANVSLGTITIIWKTSSERDNAGFYLWRAEIDKNGNYVNITQINDKLIPSTGSISGSSYSYKDSTVVSGTKYYYVIQNIHFSGKTIFHWDYLVTVTAKQK